MTYSDALLDETNPDVIQIYNILSHHTVIRDFKTGNFRVRNLKFNPESSFKSAKNRFNVEVGGWVTAKSYQNAATTDAIVTIIGNHARMCVRLRTDAKGSVAKIVMEALREINAPVQVVNEIHRAYSRNYSEANREKIIDVVFADLQKHILTMQP